MSEYILINCHTCGTREYVHISQFDGSCPNCRRIMQERMNELLGFGWACMTLLIAAAILYSLGL